MYDHKQQSYTKIEYDAVKAENKRLQKSLDTIEPVCRDMAKDMIKRDATKSAWIFWDGLMRESVLTDKLEAEIAGLKIELELTTNTGVQPTG